LKISRGGAETRGFVYDGWLPVLEIVATASGVTTNHYVWGKDLSGTLQGAGGVGGLLAVQKGSAWYFPFYDNNGNITAYVNEQGAIVAEYTYDAFGCTIEATGSMADAFRHRFSTKYFDSETGLYYYGYRFYTPKLMRWLNRDPIGEESCPSLYSFCANDAANHFDLLGLFDIYVHTEGWGGHVGIVDDQGANYDYGRYRGSYSGMGILAAGPNILIKSTGWPPQGKSHAFTIFHFNVCPTLDKKIREELAKRLAKGLTIWPDAVLKKFKTQPSPLSDTARYMGTDWSTTDNCMTFTFSILVSAAVKVANEPDATQREKDEAKALLKLAWGAVWTPTTGAAKSLLEKTDNQYDWVEQKGYGSQNEKASDDKSCCGSGY
jgi:RHS repeat-associated protein